MGVYPAVSGDSTIARWHVPDPLAERYGSFSPYNYCLGNPVNFTDPSGMLTLTGEAAQDFFGWLKSNLHAGIDRMDKMASFYAGVNGGGYISGGDAYDTWHSMGGVKSGIIPISNGSKNCAYQSRQYWIDHFKKFSFLGYQPILQTNIGEATTSGGVDYVAILYSNKTEGFNQLRNGCFEGNNPKNNWKYERLGFITNKGIVVLPGSGKGWSNEPLRSQQTLIAGIKAGIINGNTITVGGEVLNILGSIHIHPSCAQLVAIGAYDPKYCDELDEGPSGYDANALSGYGLYWVFDYKDTTVIWRGIGSYGDKIYRWDKLPFNTNF